jgi:hypothetical protein
MFGSLEWDVHELNLAVEEKIDCSMEARQNPAEWLIRI